MLQFKYHFDKKMTPNAFFLFGFLLVSSKILCISCTTTTTPNPSHEWDILIFTQRWPLTACSQWEEANKNNTCAFPNPKDIWTIHGIWPTKSGTKGPENCNKTWHFNDTMIDPIKGDLEKYWINVEKNTKLDSLWKHEWMKHGTCAATLPQLNNELHYFERGVQWIKQYNMKNILSQAQVIPNNQGYPVQKIFDSVRSVLKKTAIIECVVDRKTKMSLISEIRICFTKTLDLTDCDTVKEDVFIRVADILTNCNIKKPVMYYPNNNVTTSSVPIEILKEESSVIITIPRTTATISTLDSLYNTREYLITFYRTIKLLIWATI